MTFDPKKWANKERKSPWKRTSAIDKCPELIKALEVINEEVTSGRSNATYRSIHQEVVLKEFGVKVSESTLCLYMKNRWGSFYEPRRSEELGE